MSALEQRLSEYLAVRWVLGYKLERAGKLLSQFFAWLDERDHSVITTELVSEWATLPSATGSNWHRQRLSVVRGFAAHLHAIDPAHEVPPADLLLWRPRPAVPYLYTDGDLLRAAGRAAQLSDPDPPGWITLTAIHPPPVERIGLAWRTTRRRSASGSPRGRTRRARLSGS